MGKLIVIEGLDGSGKSTQLELLSKRLSEMKIDNMTVSFPNYASDSSALVRMYLSGAFGKEPEDVNAYAASVFYTVDRFASYKQQWGKYYENGGIVLAGRYTTSNAVHQTSKLEQSCWDKFLDWLYDFEYNKIGIPKPDKVIYLDMPVDISQTLLTGRYDGDNAKKDIHESDVEYLRSCEKAARFTAEKSGWTCIGCAQGSQPRTVQEISDDVLREVLSVLR